MVASLWKVFVSFFKITLAFVSIISPIFAVWDTNDPWPESNQARVEFEVDYFFVPVGGSWRGGTRLAQTALLVPRSLSLPMSVSIQSSNNDVAIHTNHSGFWIILLCLMAGWYLVFSYAHRWLIGKGDSEGAVLS
jgi:hypothetical protein